MDNPIFKINGGGLDRLKAALALATNYPESSKGTALGFVVDKDGGRMVIFWAEHPDMTPFPTKLSTEHYAEIVYAWLRGGATPPTNSLDDCDVSETLGWYCYREGWGHIDGYGWQAFVAIEPTWLWHGK